MPTASLEKPTSCTANINSLIKNYKVQAGGSVSVGDFVQYVNGSNVSIQGAGEVFDSTTGLYIDASVLSENRIILTYSDWNNNHYYTAVVVSLVGDSLVPGTPVILSSNSPQFPWTPNVAVLSESKVLITYTDMANNGYGTAVALSIVGTTVYVGTPLVYRGASGTYSCVLATLTDFTVFMAYYDGGNGGYGTSVIFTVSGTSISMNTPLVFYSAKISLITTGTAITDTKVIVAYRVDSSGYGNSVILTISGTTISIGSTVTYSTNAVTQPSIVSVSPTKCVLAVSISGSGYIVTIDISGVSMSYNSFSTYYAGSVSYVDISVVSETKILIVYYDTTNTLGYAVVYTISGATLTGGTVINFAGSSSYLTLCRVSEFKYLVSYSGTSSDTVILTLDKEVTKFTEYRVTNSKSLDSIDSYRAVVLSPNKVMIFYRNSTVVYAVCISIVGLEIIRGELYGMYTCSPTPQFSITVLTDSKVLIAFYSPSTNQGHCSLFTISGTTITGYTPVTFDSSGGVSCLSCTTLSESKVLVCYRRTSSDGYCYAFVANISGTTITYGDAIVLTNSSTNYISVIALSDKKAIVVYQDVTNSNYGTSVILSISGSVLTKGTAVVFNSANTLYITLQMINESSVVVAYTNGGNSNYGTAVCLSISGTAITVNTPVVFHSRTATYLCSVMKNENTMTVFFCDSNNNSYGVLTSLYVSGTTISVWYATIFNSYISYYGTLLCLGEDRFLAIFYNSTLALGYISLLTCPKVAGVARTSGSGGGSVDINVNT